MSKENKTRNFILYNLLMLSIILTLSKIVSEDLEETIYSYVTMIITKGNYQKVYTNLENKKCTFTKPDEVYINGKPESNVPHHNFPENENPVKLVWKNPITSCRCMFWDCQHIIQMDFSYFNTSQVVDMQNMF